MANDNELISDLRWDELVHLSTSLLSGGICALVFNNIYLILAALLVGFFIDIDHLFDYFHYFGIRKGLKNFRNFFNSGSYMNPAGQVFVPLHGFEYLVVLWVLGSLTGVPGLNWALAGSYLLHLSWDNFALRHHHPLAYFVVFRAIHNFDLDLFNYYG